MGGAERTRADLLEEFVLRDAWASVLGKIADATEPEGHRPIDGDGVVLELESELVGRRDVDLFSPGPHRDPGGPEYEWAYTRSIALEAAILMKLTTREAQDDLREEAARLARLAADRMARGGVDSRAGA